MLEKNVIKERRSDNMEKTIRTFVSYSWDGEEHRDWIYQLVTKLREIYGIDAVFDGILQKNNLNRMMVEQTDQADKIIIVITDKYAKKAEEFNGGVGTETQLFLNYIIPKPEKLVVIKKGNVDIPLAFQGFEYIDFTNGITESNMEKLVLKLKRETEYKVVPVTKTPQKVESKRYIPNEELIPVLKKPSKEDGHVFLIEQLAKADKKLVSLFEQTQKRNQGFDFKRMHKVDHLKTGTSFACNGRLVDKFSEYTVYSYTASFGENEAYFKLWYSKDSMLFGIFGTSENNKYLNEQYNSFQLHVSTEQIDRTLVLKNNSFDSSWEIRTGDDLGVYVFKKMMWRLDER